MNPANPLSFLPLREPTFYILLSLAPEKKHGYAILKEVTSLSQGRVQLSTGTLYEALSRLLEQGLIERTGEAEHTSDTGAAGSASPGRPRKTYRLTQTGRQVIEAEAERFDQLASAARRQLGGAWPRKAQSG